MGRQNAEFVQCAGTGQRPTELVILDTVPGVDPYGTCPVCRRMRPLKMYYLATHAAQIDRSED